MTTESKPGSSGRDEHSQASVEALSNLRGEPAWMLELRLQSVALLRGNPLAHRAEETWRRTKLTGFRLEDYRAVGSAKAPVDAARRGRGSLPKSRARAIWPSWTAPAALSPDDALASAGRHLHRPATAVREHPELVQRAFGSVVATDENKFSALHYALWNSGTFVYVPRNVVVDQPLQTVVYQSAGKQAGFHHTLVVTEGARWSRWWKTSRRGERHEQQRGRLPRARTASCTTCTCRTWPTARGTSARSACSCTRQPCCATSSARGAAA
jgi:hypothetical protein